MKEIALRFVIAVSVGISSALVTLWFLWGMYAGPLWALTSIVISGIVGYVLTAIAWAIAIAHLASQDITVHNT